MTELEALKRVLSFAAGASWHTTDLPLHDPNHAEQKLHQAAVGIVQALITRVELAAKNETGPVMEIVEGLLSEIGLVVTSYIGAAEVREVLQDIGQAGLAANLSNEAICLQIEVLLGDDDINDVSGVPEWRDDFVRRTAKNLCKAAGVAFVSDPDA